MEIQRLNKLIDQNRAINSDSTELRTKIDQLKSRLESLNAEILSYKISESNKAPVDLRDIFRRDESPGLESEGLENSGPDDINEPGFTPVE